MAHCSVIHLNRLFAARYHKTIHQYLLKLKIQSGARLLTETDLPVCRIIQEIHYSCPNAFYKRFVQEYGMTPDQYRKNLHN